jgi:ABC-type antimicrobial peptide transport system permease subunit
MAQYVEYATSMHRTTAALAGILGAVGLVLTTIGVYGMVAYRTTRRTREIGIRVALGAVQRQVIQLVLREGLALGIGGVVLGLPLALGAQRLTASMLVGLDAWSPLVFGGATAILLAAITAASLLPAWRATHIQPSITLKQ